MKRFFYICAAILFLAACTQREPTITGLEGKPLPAFDLLMSDSSTHFNTSNIPGGKPVVLFYFGPYCPYSRAQMKGILKDIELLKDIQFYLVTNWSYQDMKKFYQYYQLKNYSNIHTGVDDTDFFGAYYKATGVPYLAIYGKDKCLNGTFMGEVSGKQIRTVAMK